MGFLRYMDELEESGQLPSSRAQAGQDDAVQIMTIHQSKGLEFPVVFLADLSRQFNRSDASMSVLLDSSLYIGANVVDMEKRAYFPSLARMAIAEKKTRQKAILHAQKVERSTHASASVPDGRQRALPGRLGADGSALPDGSRRVVCRDRSQ